MSHKPLSFAIFGSVYSQYKCDFTKQLFSHLEQRNAQVFVDKPYLEFIGLTPSREMILRQILLYLLEEMARYYKPLHG